MLPGKSLVLTVRTIVPSLMALALIVVVLDRSTVISYDEGIKNGLTPAHVQRDEKYGGGFFVNVEGMHHLNCLVGQPPRLCNTQSI